MRSRCFCVTLLFAISLLLPEVQAAEWPRLRGPNGSGLDSSAPIPADWSDEHLVWRIDLPGEGQGSPVVSGERIFLLAAEEVTTASRGNGEERAVDRAAGGGKAKAKAKARGKAKRGLSYRWVALCLSRTDGSILWRKEFPAGEFRGHRFNSAASSSAAVDAERVVFTWGTAAQLTLVALDHGGDLLWKADQGPVAGGHGFGGSPMIFEDLVVLNNDQDRQRGNLFALDRATGDVAWTVERRSERISYSVPCAYRAPEGREVLVFTNWQHGFTAVDPETGEVVAEKSVFDTTTNERAISSPVVAGDLVIGTCGFTANPKHCVAMRLEGDEWIEVWRIERNVPHIPSPLVVGPRVYLVEDSGILTCVEAATGEIHYRNRIEAVEGSVFGSPVSDGEKVFFADESGNVHVLATGDEYHYLATNRLGEPCRTTPALAGGVLFLRTATKLHAISAR